MQFEWLIGGVALLVAAMVMKKVVDLGGFQGLMVSFTVVWCAFVALHFWRTGARLPAGLDMGDQRAALIGFWLAYLVAAAPSVLLSRLWLKQYMTTFPPSFDGLISWVAALCTGVTLFCLLIMSIAVAAPTEREFDGRALFLRVDLAPMQAYVLSASFLEQAPQIFYRERLPTAAKDLLRR